jgi:hypothetical protein
MANAGRGPQHPGGPGAGRAVASSKVITWTQQFPGPQRALTVRCTLQIGRVWTQLFVYETYKWYIWYRMLTIRLTAYLNAQLAAECQVGAGSGQPRGAVITQPVHRIASLALGWRVTVIHGVG